MCEMDKSIVQICKTIHGPTETLQIDLFAKGYTLDIQGDIHFGLLGAERGLN